MTPEQMQTELDRLSRTFTKNNDSAYVRNALQQIFDECFLKVLYDNNYRDALDRGFAFLRKIENSALPQANGEFRYDAAALTQRLCFCADLLCFDQDRSVLFECNDTVYINVSQKHFLFCVSNLIANAVKYSVSGEVFVTLKIRNNSAQLFIINEGEFSYGCFQKAILENGSLGFAVRFFESADCETAVISRQGHTVIAVNLPLADEKLPITASPCIDELLYDRLSVIYTAFCGH